MAGDDLIRVAERLSTILGDTCLLVGGMAVSAWGHIRATEDVDFICSLPPEDIQELLSSEGVASQHRRGDILEGDIPWVVEGELSGITFQILPPTVPVMWERAATIGMPNGSELRVVALDDLVHLKLAAGGALDFWDVAVVLQEHPELEARARRWADNLGVSAELDRWLSDPRLKKTHE